MTCFLHWSQFKSSGNFCKSQRSVLVTAILCLELLSSDCPLISFWLWNSFQCPQRSDLSRLHCICLIQTPLYFSVPRGLTYPDSTVFQCPQRSDLSRLHCISVSREVWLIQTPLYFSVPRGLTYSNSTVFQCLQRFIAPRLHCYSISVSPEVWLIQTTLYFSVPEVWLIQTPLYFSVPRGLTYPDSTVFQCPQRSDLSRLHCISVSQRFDLSRLHCLSSTFISTHIWFIIFVSFAVVIQCCVLAVSHREKPLALYLFTASQHNRDQITTYTSSGSIVFNDCLVQAAGECVYVRMYNWTYVHTHVCMYVHVHV